MYVHAWMQEAAWALPFLCLVNTSGLLKGLALLVPPGSQKPWDDRPGTKLGESWPGVVSQYAGTDG